MNNLYWEIGQKLKQARHLRGLTRDEVASRSGIERYNYIEYGALSSVAVWELAAISRVLDIEMSSLFHGELRDLPHISEEEAFTLYEKEEISMGRLAELLRKTFSETRELIFEKNYVK